MASSLMFLLSLVAISTSIAVHGQEGFLNIDCGGGNHYVDKVTGLTYTNDSAYIKSGVVRTVASTYQENQEYSHAKQLRSFPNGTRNCYILKPIAQGGSYLVRAYFLYGNYDGLNRHPRFQLHLGVNLWEEIKIDNASTYITSEIIAIAQAETMSLCLINIGDGTPFISAIDVRPILKSMYGYANASQSLVTFHRLNFGGDANKRDIMRYKNDKYDRFWKSYNQDGWKIQTTNQSISSNLYKQSSDVMATQSIPMNGQSLEIKLTLDITSKYHMLMHFAELQSLSENHTRIINYTINQQYAGKLNRTKLKYLRASTLYTGDPINAEELHLSLMKENDSTLPPIINAMEIYVIRKVKEHATHGVDVDTMEDIKTQYNVKKNWAGDPCAPKRFTWDGIQCSHEVSKNPRIIALTLSSSGLTGQISSSFGKLDKLNHLDLSNNSLTGVIPEFLALLPNLKFLNLQNNNLHGPIPKSISRRVDANGLTLIYEGNPLMKELGTNNDSKLPLIIGLTIGSMVALLVVGLLTWWTYRKCCKRVDHPLSTQIIDQEKAIGADEGQTATKVNHLNKKCYTYHELQEITNNFKHPIGEGGFGKVYQGRLIDDTPVAIKMISKATPQTSKQFKREANILTRIHHNNLVSLLGYCDEDGNKALIYELLARGSLADNLIGDKSTCTLSWRERLHISVQAAQGFHYLHEGCRPKIVHGDVKASNILLGENMEVRIGDFGMSRIFEGDNLTQTIVGTPGYIDPEYWNLGILNTGNDIYSFGIILLELITGQLAINNSREGNLLDWVKSKLETIKLEDIIDNKLQGYNQDSIWRIIEIALSCTTPTSNRRPTMMEVLSKLKECEELNNAQGERSQVISRSTFDIATTNSISYEMDPLETSHFFNPKAR